MAESRDRAAAGLTARLSALWAPLAALALGGCMVGGPASAPVAAATSGALAAGATVNERVMGAEGPLALSTWEPAEPTAIILGVHGYGDYGASTFDAAAEAWAAERISTYAYDQRGFGRNPSWGQWPGAEALIADLLVVAAEVRRRHPCVPLTVVGHSMGGGVTLAAAGQGLSADALVLAAPAIWGGAEMNPFHRLAAWGAAAVVPDRRFTGEGVVRIQASDNIPMLRALGRDPLYLRPPSAREIMGLVRVTDRAEAAVTTVRQPALLLLGGKDQILPEKAVRRVFARTAGPREVQRYPDGWHLLFRDLQAAKVWADVARFALATPPPEGCSP
ncbi:MAG: alpha/beta fold hydrolase [Pseudomonadota bacterium]